MIRWFKEKVRRTVAPGSSMLELRGYRSDFLAGVYILRLDSIFVLRYVSIGTGTSSGSLSGILSGSMTFLLNIMGVCLNLS